MNTQYFVKSAVTIASILFSFSAFAQEQVKEITFEDDNVEGELLAPSGSTVTGLIEEDTTSLIKVRENFVDEMIKSTEEL